MRLMLGLKRNRNSRQDTSAELGYIHRMTAPASLTWHDETQGGTAT